MFGGAIRISELRPALIFSICQVAGVDMMPRHFLELEDARTVETDALWLTRRAVGDLCRRRALGVVHGPTGQPQGIGLDGACVFQLEKVARHHVNPGHSADRRGQNGLQLGGPDRSTERVPRLPQSLRCS